jgi:Uma2 family endonuclease
MGTAMSEIAAPPGGMTPGGMTVEQFLVWVRRQPKGKYELERGQVVVDMAPEVARHARAKLATVNAFAAAIQAAGAPCEAFIDGLGIRTDADTLYVPDVAVNCGDAVDPAAQTLPAPIIVVEILSPSSERKDVLQKFAGYFRLPSVRHYLLVDAAARTVMHHRKEPDGTARTSIQGSGPLTFDPPGLTIAVEQLFEPG